MNYTREKLERFCRHWQGQSLNDQLVGREPTPKITVEMDASIWERIWSEDATQEMYEALKETQKVVDWVSRKITGLVTDNSLRIDTVRLSAQALLALAKEESKDDIL